MDGLDKGSEGGERVKGVREKSLYEKGGGYVYCFFFFNDTATTEIYTLSLHDALPISIFAFLFSIETA